MAETTKQDPAVDATAGGDTAPTSTEDGKGSKQAVLADLASERDKRQDLERQVQALQAAQAAQSEALAKAFGLKPEETSDVSVLASQVAALQKQFADTQRQNAVLSVANEHGITGKDDLDLLASVADEAKMRALAGRIKASDGTPGTPKPDLSQGGKDAPGAAGPAQDFANFIKQALG